MSFPIRALTLTVLSTAALIAVYYFAVLTARGQTLDNAALEGADHAHSGGRFYSEAALDVVTLSSLGVAIGLTALIGIFRRRPALVLAGTGTIVVSILITEILKLYVLPRPVLVPGEYPLPSFPSGHATIVISTLFAWMIVVPFGARALIVLVGFIAASIICLATLTAQWHRVSDSVGAGLVSLVIASIASFWLWQRGLIHSRPGPRHLARVMFLVVPLTLLTGVGLGVGGLLFFRKEPSWFPYHGESASYLGGLFLTVSAIGLMVLAFWGVWRGIEIAPRKAKKT